ncbi:MAG: hypothetical protein ACRCYV_08555, partial [Aeromonas sp.]
QRSMGYNPIIVVSNSTKLNEKYQLLNSPDYSFIYEQHADFCIKNDDVSYSSPEYPFSTVSYDDEQYPFFFVYQDFKQKIKDLSSMLLGAAQQNAAFIALGESIFTKKIAEQLEITVIHAE